MRLLYLTGWGYVAIASALIYRATHAEPYQGLQLIGAPIGSPGQQWFTAVRAHCNPVEVQIALAQSPPPAGAEGQSYRAACLALAGKIEAAAAVIDDMPANERVQAAGVVFEVVHPVADAGDDDSAGPMMELVLRYWPNHYMALYHAGTAEYRMGKYDLAKANLEAFLVHYKQDDGWVSNARTTLQAIAERKRP